MHIRTKLLKNIGNFQKQFLKFASMNSRSKKILNYTVWAAVAVVLLYFSFRGVDWKNFWNVLSNCRWSFVALAMLAGVCSFFVRAMRWRLLLVSEDPDTKLLDCYDGFTIGRLCDFAVPHIGEFVRCGYVLSPRLTYDKALGTVVLERVWDILMLVLLTVLLLVFKWTEFGSFFVDKIVSPVSGRLDVNLWWLAFVLIAASAAIIWAVIALRSKSRVCSKICGFFKGIWQGAATCLKMRRKGLFLLLTVLLWFLFLLMSWFIIKALPSDFGLTIIDAMFIMLVGSIAGIVPVPGGFGAFHYLVALALQTIYGIPFETGIIFATLSHESQAVTMILCGLLSYIHQLLKRRKTS